MMLLLAGFRRLVEQDRMVRDGRWAEGRPALLKIPRLMGQTLGFISFGRVARAVAKRARPVRPAHDGLRSLHPGNADVRPRRDPGDAERGAVAIRLRLDARPARPEVHHMLTEKHFRQMKKGSVFINTGRGATVDEESLIKALQEELDRPRRPRRAGEGAALAQQSHPQHGERDPDRPCRLGLGTVRRGAQAPRGLRIVTGASGHVAGKLRQSVGAAEHRAPPLATRQHGSRTEQLGGRRAKRAGTGTALHRRSTPGRETS